MSEIIKRGTILDGEIIDITHEGKGVAKINGLTVFIDGGTIGDIVKIKISEMKKRFALGKVLEIVKPSVYRVDSLCKVSENCGGCQLRDLKYEKQLELKTNKVINDIEKIGKLKNVIVHNIIGMEDPLRYRNKVQVPVDENHIGFYKKESHNIVDTDECIIQHELSEKAINIVREFMKKFNVSGYNRKTAEGNIRHVITKVSFKTKDTMIIIVTNTKRLPYYEELIDMLKKEIPSVKSIVQNINKNKTNLVLGDKNKVLYGDEKIIDYIGALKFNISPQSFFQINSIQTEILYKKALEYADLKGKETVYDIYCGIGTISLFLAQKAKKVYGIEVISEAIEDAKENAELNGIENVEFYEGTAETVLPELYKEGIKADVIVLDPPRKGCEKEVLDTIVSMKPERVVYVSCNPSTLARDLNYLSNKGFLVKEVQPVDVFAGSMHVECVVLLVNSGQVGK
ncbi:23S rRNA (uracil-5-)-methyltransferase RumA [Gottschalkia acidurici 9a]|uniref:23S rRNA (Uracil-5-)-methyltransferase RumA n=1 Tax=Gottschalkia acidurici (strain ATCC 7906 / DSM 604 / BCRC 14475 / CIP 104303 / KCTC 5404 / NCIMB 10678 / 9a) TaxID=1128398 RepID=K0B312_GOTA9|nr:23S rRNA (uracil(1939)-C(5))-methyltransferase RlmD [Gottschalkia acidurici]AFS79021.1 23S rRNA (uracil-5-)-methyltransferase RumA [Gottschalkia acidurici 9a]